MGTKVTNMSHLDSTQYQLSPTPPTKNPLLALVFIPLTNFSHSGNSAESLNNKLIQIIIMLKLNLNALHRKKTIFINNSITSSQDFAGVATIEYPILLSLSKSF